MPSFIIESERKDYSRLVLGTAQMGMPYGIANSLGQPTSGEVKAMLLIAFEHGITEFDTAQAYGKSEQILGENLYDLGLSQHVKIITKLDPKLNHLDKEVLSRAIDASLKRLKISRLFGLMLHKEESFELVNQGLGEILSSFVEDGRVDRIGISIYIPEKALKALVNETIDIIQIPTNLLDQRFFMAGVFDSAMQLNKQVYIRSPFLQGLIMMDKEKLPLRLQYADQILTKLENLSRHFKLDKKTMALIYLRDKYKQAKILFGAESKEQVRQNCNCWNREIPENFLGIVDETFKNVEETIVNPLCWPK